MYDRAFRTLFLVNPARLSLEQNHLKIALKNSDEVKIALSDILCVVLESTQITLSVALLEAFALNKILVFSCDKYHLPCGIFTPFLGYYKSLSLLEKQIALGAQNKAILWQQIIKIKIFNQAKMLEMTNSIKADELFMLSKNVKLGDSKNYEATSAMLYFPALFGKNFRRTDKIKESFFVNSALNYGYAILRGVIVRALCASGLNPLLGIFHKNQYNPFNLADDFLEPYRIFVDFCVYEMLKNDDLKNSFEIKHRIRLVNLINNKVRIEKKSMAISQAIMESVWSFVRFFENKNKLIFPLFDGVSNNGSEIYENFGDV